MNTAGPDEIARSDQVAKLPVRRGPRPTTTNRAPHSQLDQQAAPMLSPALLERLSTLPGVSLGPSRRAPPGMVGLQLAGSDLRRSGRAFLIDAEFAHVHPGEDGSLHLTLPEPLRSDAIAACWAEAHPAVGLPTISPDTVMVYAPRDEEEVDVVTALVTAFWRNAQADGLTPSPVHATNNSITHLSGE